MNTRKQEPRLKTPPLRRMLLERKVTSLKEYCQHLPSHATNDQISEIESGYMLAAYRNPHHDSYSWHICARGYLLRSMAMSVSSKMAMAMAVA